MRKSIWLLPSLITLGFVGTWYGYAAFDEMNETSNLPMEDVIEQKETTQETSPTSSDIQIPSEELSLAEEFGINQETIDQQIQEFEELVGIQPAQIDIPAIDISTTIIDVGLLDDGSMGVPDNDIEVGWYEPGTLPGENGHAVMAGHVDSRTGPAIFFNLDQLEVGDEIIIADNKGEKRHFEVEKLESYPYDDAPLREIFGSSDEARLHLITCTGLFDREQGTHEERLVVYTKLVAEDTPSIPAAPTNIEMNGQLLTFYANRDDLVIGYRIYEITENGETEYVHSIANHERKSFFVSNTDREYIVKTVNAFGEESE